MIAGSLASSLHGIPRATHDVDIVADIKLHHVEELIDALKNDFYVDNTEIVTIGKGKVFLRDGGKNRIVYGNKAYEDGKEITTGTVFFSSLTERYEDILTEMVFTTFAKREEKRIDIEVHEEILFSISDCKGLILEINDEEFILTSSSYARVLPMEKGEYRLGINVRMIRQAVAVYIDAEMLEPA